MESDPRPWAVEVGARHKPTRAAAEQVTTPGGAGADRKGRFSAKFCDFSHHGLGRNASRPDPAPHPYPPLPAIRRGDSGVCLQRCIAG